MIKNIRNHANANFAEIIGGHGRRPQDWMKLVAEMKKDWPDAIEDNIELSVITDSNRFRWNLIATMKVEPPKREGYSNIDFGLCVA